MEIGYWQQEDDAFEDHQRWSQSCGFIRGLFVGNIPIDSSEQLTASSEHPTRSSDVYGSHFELRSNSKPERCKKCFISSFVMCLAFIDLSLIFIVFLATNPTIYKHIRH